MEAQCGFGSIGYPTWRALRLEAKQLLGARGALEPLLDARIFHQASLANAVASQMAALLPVPDFKEEFVDATVLAAIGDDPALVMAFCRDLQASSSLRRAPNFALLQTFLLNRGCLALTAFRVAISLLRRRQTAIALPLHAMATERTSAHFDLEATIGCGIGLESGTDLHIGAGAIISDDVTLCDGVTVKQSPRHRDKVGPRILKGAVLQRRAHIIGDIEVGEYVTVPADSVIGADCP